MPSVTQGMRQRLLEALESQELLTSIRELINRELIPVVIAIRDELNRIGGDIVSTSAPAFSVLATHKLVLFTSSTATATFPSPSTCPGAVVTVICNSGGGSILYVTTEDGSEMLSTAVDGFFLSAAGNGSATLMSDGTLWRRIATSV